MSTFVGNMRADVNASKKSQSSKPHLP